MAKENKTKATEASVTGYLDRIEDETRRKDCKALAQVMKKATKADPKMWGPSIVGFGSYHYKYDSGHEGDSCLTGFASRSGNIVLYLGSSFPKRDQLLAKLGKHKVAGGCLYVGKLDDVDPNVLEQMIVASVAERKKQHV
jgi:hypothetical protein